MSPTRRRRTFWVLAGVVLLIVGAWFVSRTPPPPPRSPLPDPNGYADLQRATTLLKGEMADPREISDDELNRYLETNRAALDAVRVGVSREIRVPTPPTFNTLEAHVQEISMMRALGRLLAAEGEHARRVGDWDRMVASVTNAVLLARGINQGDVLIDEMVGAAIEQVALIPLRRSLSDISAPAARQAAPSLLALDATRIPFDQVIEGEKRFGRTAGLLNQIAGFVGRSSLQKVHDRARTNRYRLARETRLLAMQLAVRACTLERGTRPERMSDLVPDFLPAVPTDPATGVPLKLSDLPALPDATSEEGDDTRARGAESRDVVGSP